MARKICSRCGQYLLLEDFHIDNYNLDGLSRYCKECKKEINHKWNEDFPEKMSECCRNWRNANLEYARKQSRTRSLIHYYNNKFMAKRKISKSEKEYIEMESQGYADYLKELERKKK